MAARALRMEDNPRSENWQIRTLPRCRRGSFKNLQRLSSREICWRGAERQVTCWLRRITHAFPRCSIRGQTREPVNMNRRNISRLLVTVFWGLSVLDVSANGFGLASQDAFATARGEAFAATADNPSAIFYNPAGITQLAGNNLRAGLYGIYLDPSYSPPSGRYDSGNTYHSSDHLAAVPQLFYTYTAKDWPVSFGLGVYAPFGGRMDWPYGASFNTVSTQGKLAYLTANPVIAVKLAPSLSLAGGVMVNYVNMDLEQVISYPTRNPNFFRFTGYGWSVGYNLGLRWQPIDQI